jgi:hypothetical protein
MRVYLVFSGKQQAESLLSPFKEYRGLAGEWVLPSVPLSETPDIVEVSD